MKSKTMLRTGLVIILSLFVLVPSVIFSFYVNTSMAQIAIKQYDSLINEFAIAQAMNIENYIKSLNITANVIAKDETINNYITCPPSSSQKTAFQLETIAQFSTFCRLDDNISGILLCDNNGTILAANDSMYINDIYLYSGLPGSAVIDTFLEQGKSGEYHVVANVGINEQYTLNVFYDKAKLEKLFNGAIFSTNGRLMLLDSNGVLIDDTRYVGDIYTLELQEYNAIRRTVVEEEIVEGQKYSYVIGKKERSAFFANSGDTNWEVISIGEVQRAYDYANPATFALTNITVWMSLVLILFAVFLVFFITKPLYIIKETLLKIKKGDHEVRIEVNSKNEYGAIAHSFNDIIDEIIVSESRYRTIVEMSDNIIFEWNFKTNEVFFSNNFNKYFSYRAPTDHFNDSFLMKGKVHPEDNEYYHKNLEKLARGEALKRCEFRWKNIYGDYIWVLMRTATIRDKEDNIVKVVGAIIDIDRAKKSETLLTTRASFDALTALYNRSTTESAINNEIDLVAARKTEFAIMFIDIDDFKIYNDKYSHATGDQVLRFTAKTIADAVKNYGFAGRYGGDEFIVCIRNSDINDPSKTAQIISERLRNGFVGDNDIRLSVSVSIGITTIVDSSKNVDEIIGMADDAMYRIKKSGKSNFCYF